MCTCHAAAVEAVIGDKALGPPWPPAPQPTVMVSQATRTWAMECCGLWVVECWVSDDGLGGIMNHDGWVGDVMMAGWHIAIITQH